MRNWSSARLGTPIQVATGRIVAKRRLERSADGGAFVYVALPDVQPQRADLIQLRADCLKRNSQIFQTLRELATDISGTDDLSLGIPGNLAGDMHGVTERRRDDRHLRETVSSAIEYPCGRMKRSTHGAPCRVGERHGSQRDVSAWRALRNRANSTSGC